MAPRPTLSQQKRRPQTPASKTFWAAARAGLGAGALGWVWGADMLIVPWSKVSAQPEQTGVPWLQRPRLRLGPPKPVLSSGPGTPLHSPTTLGGAGGAAKGCTQRRFLNEHG